MSTAILAPTANPSQATTVTPSFAFAMDDLVQCVITNGYPGPVQPCWAALQLSGDGGHTWETVRSIPGPIAGGETLYPLFGLASYARHGQWTDARISFGGNLAQAGTPAAGGAVTVAAYGDGSTWCASGGAVTVPSFTSFGITGVSTQEVGATLAAGPYTFTWATSNPSSVAANSIAIADTTGGTTLATGLANTGSDAITLGSITHTTTATQTWTISGEDTNTIPDTFTRTFTVAWDWRVYAGTSSNPTLTANQIKALADSSALQSGFAGTYSYASSAGYKYLCYPDSMGSVATFLDGNGFIVSMADSSDNAAYSNTADAWSYALVSVTNAQSATTNYRVYRTANSFSQAFTLKVS